MAKEVAINRIIIIALYKDYKCCLMQNHTPEQDGT